MIVVDASVAIKWFVHDEPQRKEALLVLEAIAKHPDQFAVPEFFFNEMLSVLCRMAHIRTEHAQRCLDDLSDLGMNRIGNGQALLAKAAQVAIEWNISGYDAIYVSCAKLMKGQWLTADAKAVRKIPDIACYQLL